MAKPQLDVRYAFLRSSSTSESSRLYGGSSSSLSHPPLSEEHIDKALQLRLEGNEKFKSGDLAGAMMAYHSVLLSLRGLESAISTLYPTAPVSVTSEEEEHKKLEGEPLTKAEQVKQAILFTYINQAAILLKQEKWKRAFDCCQQAKKIDEKNTKANFREAQARIGMGEVNAGRKILEELQKTNPDSAIANALNVLNIAEQAQASKTHAQFRGMFNTKKPASGNNNGSNNGEGNSSTEATAGTSSGASTVKPETPKIVELES
ncbi:hypothetical protein JCM11641_007497 [Rhodosporidiobolus odoratus]